MPVSATMPRSCSQSVHAGPRASRISTARACGRADSERAVGDAVVADHRRREADELLGEARVGDDLLVAGHRGREDRLAERRSPRRATDSPRKTVPSSSARKPRHAAYTSRPAAIVARTSPLSVSPSSHEFTERERKPSSRDPPARVQVEQDEVRRRADGDRAARRARRRAPGPADIRSSSVSSGSEAGLDEVRVERGERGLEPGDAERRRLERHLLLVARVRRVVGGDRARSSRPCSPSMSAVRSARRRGAAGSSSGSGRASGPPRRSGRDGAA